MSGIGHYTNYCDNQNMHKAKRGTWEGVMMGQSLIMTAYVSDPYTTCWCSEIGDIYCHRKLEQVVYLKCTNVASKLDFESVSAMHI